MAAKAVDAPDLRWSKERGLEGKASATDAFAASWFGGVNEKFIFWPERDSKLVAASFVLSMLMPLVPEGLDASGTPLEGTCILLKAGDAACVELPGMRSRV